MYNFYDDSDNDALRAEYNCGIELFDQQYWNQVRIHKTRKFLDGKPLSGKRKGFG